MKTIAVNIRFTSECENALRYAVELNKLLGYTLKLYYFNDSEKILTPNEVDKILVKIDSVAEQYVEYTFYEKVVYENSLTHFMNNPASKEIELLVLAATPAVGLIDYLFGNKLLNAIKHAHVPLLIIPSKFEFTAPKIILHCSDYERIEDYFSYYFLRTFSKKMHSTIRLLHVKTNDSEPKEEHIEESASLKQFIKEEVDCHQKLVMAPSILRGINFYIRFKGDINMVSIINHDHSLIADLFQLNHTKQIALTTKLPLLILPAGG